MPAMPDTRDEHTDSQTTQRDSISASQHFQLLLGHQHSSHARMGMLVEISRSRVMMRTEVIVVIFRPKPPQARISFCGITSEMHQALQHSGFWMKNQLNIHEYSRLYRCVGLFPRIIYCDRDQTRRPSRYRCVGGVQLRYRRKIPHF
jgi:hypothetical protein